MKVAGAHEKASGSAEHNPFCHHSFHHVILELKIYGKIVVKELYVVRRHEGRHVPFYPHGRWKRKASAVPDYPTKAASFFNCAVDEGAPAEGVPD